LASGESGPARSRPAELRKRLLTEPGDMLELALNGDSSDGVRRVRLLYGLRGELTLVLSSDS